MTARMSGRDGREVIARMADLSGNRGNRETKRRCMPSRSGWLTGLLVLGLAIYANGASAENTGTWSTAGTGGSATVGGVTVTVTTSGGNASGTQSLLNTNYWTNPYAGGGVNGGPSIEIWVAPFGTNRTATITFSKPVDNPVIHLDRLGGTAAGNASSSRWNLTELCSGGRVSYAACECERRFHDDAIELYQLQQRLGFVELHEQQHSGVWFRPRQWDWDYTAQFPDRLGLHE